MQAPREAERQTFLLRLRQIAEDVDRNLASASLDSLNDLRVTVESALQQAAIAVDESRDDVDALIRRFQHLVRLIEARRATDSGRDCYEIDRGNTF